ncbi:MAG: stage III sporulation protein AF [Firmicutes bacterium]|nr:stage III sporulation protein AF [Bacillota bacterium]
MTEVYTWVKNILLVIVALNFFQILIPESTMARYLRFLFSLIILASILEPVIMLVNQS